MSKLTLYEIPDRFRELFAALEENGGELTPELEAEWDLLPEEASRKADFLAMLIREGEANTAALKAEAELFKKRAQVVENATKRTREYLTTCVERFGGKIQGEKFCPRLVANGGNPSVRWVGDTPFDPEQVVILLPGSAITGHSLMKPPAPPELDAGKVRDLYTTYLAELERAREDGRQAALDAAREVWIGYEDEGLREHGLTALRTTLGLGVVAPEDDPELREFIHKAYEALGDLIRAEEVMPQWDGRIVVERGRSLRL